MDSPTKFLFENDNYYVRVSPTANEYEVINKVTGVTEVKTAMLPDAYMAAAGLNDALVKKPWAWYSKEDVAAGMDSFLTGPAN